MEILSNFSSIYCFVAFVIGAVFMLAILSIAVMGKEKEPRNEATELKNKVCFYVKRVTKGLELLVKDRFGNPHFLYYIRFGDNYLIDTRLFEDIKEGEIREVFI